MAAKQELPGQIEPISDEKRLTDTALVRVVPVSA
jgi:hypothetical protein